MLNTNDVKSLLDRNGVVVDTDGTKIGKIGQVYLDNETGNPEWVTVSTGLFGTAESFVPLANATVRGDDIEVPFSKEKVKDAPRMDADGELSETEEQELFTYYGTAGQSGAPLATDTTRSDYRDRDHDHDESAVVGHDTSGPTTDDAMTRSEERLDVGTARAESGRARLRKYIVSEQVTQTVPVSHEEVTIEREPITDGNVGDALSGGDLTEEEHEVVLNADQVVVNKETVPVERVKLGKQTVTEEQTVTEQVRKEQIDTDHDVVHDADRSADVR